MAASALGIVADTHPDSPASGRLLPVVDGLNALLPDGGLRPGSTVAVERSTALALALVAEATQAGSWCAAVGLPRLGLAAAAELGVTLERFVLVPAPGRQWPSVTAEFLDAVDLVMVHPADRIRPGDARRLAARARERRAVLIPIGAWGPGPTPRSGTWGPGPKPRSGTWGPGHSPRLPTWERPDARLVLTDPHWQGLEDGHGHLHQRLVEVSSSGRGAFTRPRRAQLWLPGPDGRVQGLAEPSPELVQVG